MKAAGNVWDCKMSITVNGHRIVLRCIKIHHRNARDRHGAHEAAQHVGDQSGVRKIDASRVASRVTTIVPEATVTHSVDPECPIRDPANRQAGRGHLG